ncbi:MAG: DMT family transporter [Acidimicrobiia bacterium]|nr:DMT family transporter [Acidimicrobiia bacterium]
MTTTDRPTTGQTTTGRSGSPRPPGTTPSSDVRRVGIAVAGLTAVISGFSVFVNGYGVQRFDDPTTYTTAKNLVAAALITTVLVVWRHVGRPSVLPADEPGPELGTGRRRLSLAAIAVIGGSVPFVLFFEGLTRVSSSDAAFIHKTLVAWVAVLGVVLLRERLSLPHYLAIGLILVGYATLAGGVGFPVLGAGEALILVATLCWSFEVVVARAVLRHGVGELAVSTSRMLGGVGILLAWAVVRGAAGDLLALSAEQWRWAAVTGILLSAYVITWHNALARAQAVDVTAMLVVGAVITALLNTGVRDLPLRPVGVVLIGLGGLVVAASGLRPRSAVRPA